MPSRTASLAAVLEAEIAWFGAVLDRRLRAYTDDTEVFSLRDWPAPSLRRADSYSAICRAARLDAGVRLVLTLALLPRLRPQALDLFLIRNQAMDRAFTEFGGAADTSGGFRPTRQTALFLLAADDMALRLPAMTMFARDAPLVRHHLLAPQDDDYAPWLPLDPHPDLWERLLGGTAGG